MVVIRTALVYFAAIVTGVLAAQDSISVALQLYPTCAVSTSSLTHTHKSFGYELTFRQITCLAETVPGSACELDDSDCLCHDEPLNNNLTACVRETCSTVDALGKRSTKFDG